MAFSGNQFIFDSIPSSVYGLYICSPDGGSVRVPGSNDVEPVMQEVYGRPVPYIFGVRQTPVIQFDVSFFAMREITADESNAIQSWLFGQQKFKKLQIVQPDMESMYFNCLLKNPQVRREGNLIVGYDATVFCDAPWGWGFEKTFYRAFTDLFNQFTIINSGGNNDYLYPHITVKMGVSGGNFNLFNVSEGNRATSFTGLAANETLTVDNDLNIITSSTGLKRLGNFNKLWFRLIPGKNIINILGNVASITIKYKVARKLGG